MRIPGIQLLLLYEVSYYMYITGIQKKTKTYYILSTSMRTNVRTYDTYIPPVLYTWYIPGYKITCTYVLYIHTPEQ